MKNLDNIKRERLALLDKYDDINDFMRVGLVRTFVKQTIDLINQRSSEMLINQNKEMNEQCAKKVQETVSWCKEMMEEVIGRAEPEGYQGIHQYKKLPNAIARNRLREEQCLRARTLLDHPTNGDIKSNVTTNDDK